MKRNLNIIFILLVSSRIFGLSYAEYPLNSLIDKSEFIIKGYVIDTLKNDSLTKYKIVSPYRKRGYYNVDGSKTAIVKVITRIKGQISSDTIWVPYHPTNNYYSCPDFKPNDTVIFFLNRINSSFYFGLTNPKYGAKLTNIDSYSKSTTKYLQIIEKPDSVRGEMKFEWLVDISTTPGLTWDGTYVLRKSKYEYNSESRKKLKNALLMNLRFERSEEYLLEIVSNFGSDFQVVHFCISNLEFYVNDELYYLYCFDLMNAINKMDNKIKYRRLIKKYENCAYSNKEKKNEISLAIIRKFIEESRKHYA